MAKQEFAHVSKQGIGIRKVGNVYDACQECSVDWRPLGSCLGLSQPQLEEIAAKTKNDPEESLERVLATWLQKDTLPGSPDPSYYTLCHAVAKGGGNPALAERIAEEHPASSGNDAMRTFKKVLRNMGESTESSQNLKLLVVGKTGAGKSTLINNIIELRKEYAKEGDESDCCTDTVQCFDFNVTPHITVTLIDSPGLQDTQKKEQSCIQLMKSECQDVSLVLYCMKMNDHRLTDDDIMSMQKLHEAFGPKFWERVVFVLTFANSDDYKPRYDHEQLNDDRAFKEEVRKQFTRRVENRASGVKKVLKDNLHLDSMLVDKIEFLPAGDNIKTPKCPLPDREDWLLNLLESCYHQIKNGHMFTKLSLDEKIHLAVIIDNDVATDEKGETVEQSNDTKIKATLEKFGFCVLYFSGLSSESIVCLLESLQCVKNSELASFGLVFLSKGSALHITTDEKSCLSFKKIFDDLEISDEVPKFFFFLSHPENPENKFALKDLKLPKNFLALVVSPATQPSDSCPSPALKAFTTKFDSSKPLKEFFKAMQEECPKSELLGELSDNYVLPTCYEPSSFAHKKNFCRKKLSLYRGMWDHVRCKTVDVLLSSRDEVLAIVRAERITKITASATSLAVGGGLVVGGIAAAPFTFGASLGLTIAGGAVGAAAGASGIVASIVSKVMSNGKLKEAQKHIKFDQQFSHQVNDAAEEYSKLLACKRKSSYAGEVGGGIQAVASGLGRMGVVAGIGMESAIEGSAMAIRGAARTAGMVLAGVSLVVTVPLDIGFIAYNSYLLHQASKSKSGKSDGNDIVKQYDKQIEEMLKSTFTTVDVKQYIVEELDDADIGDIISLRKKPPLTICTIISGSFILPEGATLVSAVYDVLMEEKLQAPVPITIEHCVDISHRSIAEKMTFASATVDFEKKVFVFTPLKGGIFPQGQTHGSISLSDSSLLCILLIKGEHPQNDHQLMIKYAAQCSTTKELHNYWKRDIAFTKCLLDHKKYIQMDTTGDRVFDSHEFKFERPRANNELPRIKLENFRIDNKGWCISPDSTKPMLNAIYKLEIDTAELQDFSKPHNTEIFPSLTFDIQKKDEETSDPLNIEVNGTNLSLVITQHCTRQ